MRHYYNEIEPSCVAWLRELIVAGLIADGDVDGRSIADVTASDLRGYTQCHFFAGVGGWPIALRRAGVPDDFPCWTGSCPCQPFSVAAKTTGSGRGFADARHLFPVFAKLVETCRPAVLFGEQVASPAGREWFARVSTSLDALGYVAAAADLCAAGVGAPHIRQRIYWMAYSAGVRQELLPTLQKSESEPFWREIDGSHWRRNGQGRRTPRTVCCASYGIPCNTLRLRGYGNAIVPPLASEFIQAAIASIGDAQNRGGTAHE